MTKTIYVLLVAWTTALTAHGQDSTLQFTQLKQVDIIEKRATPQTLSPHTEEKAQSLAEFLDQKTGSLVKFNGVSGVSTLNLNGLGGQHAALIWNDVNLQSSMNGFSDLNLVPVFLFDQVDVSAGFGDQPLGNGLGGALSLNTVKVKNEILLDWGSFNAQKAGLSLGVLNRKKTKLSIRTYAASADNDFRYTKLNGEESKLENARFRQWHFAPQFSHKINSKSQLTADLWYLNAQRGIPPTLSEARSIATQDDENLRAAVSYYHNHSNEGKSRNSKVGISYINEKIRFEDSLSGIFGDNNAQSVLATVKQGLHSTNFVKDITTSLFLVGSAGMMNASTLSYNEEISEPSASALVRFQQKGFANRWIYNASLKTEHYLDQQPWAFEANAKYRFNETWKLSVFAGKTYRFPTFNDLFWTPGGNPELQVENALKSHVQVEYSSSRNFKAWVQIHQSNVDNWIQWVPGETGIWGAENVKKVWARGMDLNMKYSKYFWRGYFSTSANYSYTRAENRSQMHFVVPGSQLVYVPRHKGLIDLGYHRNNWRFHLKHQVVGARFITADNSASLPLYQLDHLQLSYRIRTLKATVSVNNIFNVEYQSTANVPMPYRNASISLYYNFKDLFK